MRHRHLPAAASLLLIALAGSAAANDVQPRLFTNIPVGMNFVSVSYTRSEGNVSVNPNLAVDVQAQLDTLAVGYAHSFGIYGKSALFTAILPAADLGLTGLVLGERASFNGSGMTDPIVNLAINLYGAPALERSAFGEYRQRTIVGFNLEVSPPWGAYNEDKLINFGANRWTITPELGLSHRIGRFSLEGAGAFSWFSDNEKYFGGRLLEQDLVLIVRGNVLYHFDRPGTWIGVGGLYVGGGETRVDGVKEGDVQKPTWLGAAISLPFGRRHNLLFKYSAGVTTRIGADFDNYNVVYTYQF